MKHHTDRNICIRIDQETFIALKLRLVSEGKSFQHLLAEFIKDYLAKKPKTH